MSTDALVVKFYDTAVGKYCYVFYDHTLDTYAIRGECQDRATRQKEYSFYCNNVNDVHAFLQVVFSDAQSLKFSMLNYSNLPKTSDEIEYEFLKENEKSNNLISDGDLVLYNIFSKELPTPIFRYELYTNDPNLNGTAMSTVSGFVFMLLETVRNVCNDY